MKLKADLFPYPVLSSVTNDYVNSSFSAQCQVRKIAPSRMDLEVTFQLSDPKLKELIASKKVAYAVHVEGIASSYREICTSNVQSEITIHLDTAKVGEKVEVNMVLLVLESIKNYHNVNFNPEFYEKDYHVRSLERGNILAFEPYVTLEFGLENKISSNTKSMIRVSGVNEDYMSVNLDKDFIQVRLPKKIFQQYKTLSKSDQVSQNMLMTMIVLPALSYVISCIQNGEDVEDKEWYSSLKKILEVLNYNEENIKEADALMVAQQLLDYPLATALEGYYNERKMNDEED